MNALSSDADSVRLLCSRRAHHTYEVTLTSQPHAGAPSRSRSVADVLRRIAERKNGGIALRREYSTTALPADMEERVLKEARRKFAREDFDGHKRHRLTHRPEGGDSTLARSKSEQTMQYGECCPEKPTAVADESSGDTTTVLGNRLTSARKKLIQFLQTEEFFDEYSFIALMALMLGHMFRLFVAVFMLGCTAQRILGVYVYVWRFMQARVADILDTYGGPQAACKFAVFCAELIVLFTCILVFTWAIYIPVCSLIAVVVANIVYLIT